MADRGALWRRTVPVFGIGLAFWIAGAPSLEAAGVPYNVGDVFVGVGAGKIKHFSPTGTLLDTLDTLCGGGDTLGMAFDSSGNLFGTANFGCTPQVYKFDTSGTLIGPVAPALTSAESVVFDSGGNYFVGQPDGTRTIRKYSSGAFLTEFTVATQNRGTDWIDLASDQCTMFYTSEGSSVKRYNVCTNTQGTDFSTALSTAYAFRLLPGGGALVANSANVKMLDASGVVTATYTAPGESVFFALNRDPDGLTFWTAGLSTGNVYRFAISPAAPPITTFNSGRLGQEVAGLGVFGELIVSQPPGGGGGPAVVVPTLSFPMLGLLCAALIAAALLLIRR
jgi:hypothetical protein